MKFSFEFCLIFASCVTNFQFIKLKTISWTICRQSDSFIFVLCVFYATGFPLARQFHSSVTKLLVTALHGNLPYTWKSGSMRGPFRVCFTHKKSIVDSKNSWSLKTRNFSEKESKKGKDREKVTSNRKPQHKIECANLPLFIDVMRCSRVWSLINGNIKRALGKSVEKLNLIDVNKLLPFERIQVKSVYLLKTEFDFGWNRILRKNE